MTREDKCQKRTGKISHRICAHCWQSQISSKNKYWGIDGRFFSSINGRMCRLGGIEWEPSNCSDIFVLDVRHLFPRHIIVISIVPPVREESKAKELTYPHLVFSWPHVTCAYIESSKLMFLNPPFKSRWKMHLVSNKFTCKLINKYFVHNLFPQRFLRMLFEHWWLFCGMGLEVIFLV